MKAGDLVRVKAPPLVREVTCSTGTVPVGTTGLVIELNPHRGVTLLAGNSQMRVNRIFLEVLSEAG
jgi:hypothetical protein